MFKTHEHVLEKSNHIKKLSLALDKIIVCLLVNACSQELIQIDMLSTVLYIYKVSTYDSVSRS